MIKTNLLFSKTKDYIDITSSFWNHMFLDITFFELLFLNEFTDLEEKNALGLAFNGNSRSMVVG